MAGKDEIQSFLDDFKQKAKIFGIVYYPRPKNTEALLNLGMTPVMRTEFLMKLTVKDYYKGPTTDPDPKRADFFEFGITIKGQEIYIKLSLGRFGKEPHCMSFHLAERPITYPYK